MRAEVAGRKVRHLARNRQRECSTMVETRCGLLVESKAPAHEQPPCRSCYR